MPATLDVSCPTCGKELKVPAELEGKRVKCKKCQEIFTVKAPAKAPAAKGGGKPPAPAAPPEPKKSPFADDDDEETEPGKAAKPMEVIKEDDVARCPHCAKELDPPDAEVCLHCGFNNKTRVKAETRKVIAHDATDWTMHLLPGIIALVIVILLVSLDIYCGVNMRGWLEGSDLESDEKDLTGRKKMFVPPGAFIAFIIALSMLVIVPAARFAFRRLVLEYKPEEKVKK
jgi:DNA-directed RNA polymerase subunit RPC12/RpoP